MKTLGVLVLFIASVIGLVAVLSHHEDDFVRIEPVASRPEPLPSPEPAPPVEQGLDQGSALQQVDPGAVDRAMALQSLARRP